MGEALEVMIANMSKKTSKSNEEWFTILKTQTFAKRSKVVNFLKKEHGVTHGFVIRLYIYRKKRRQKS